MVADPDDAPSETNTPRAGSRLAAQVQAHQSGVRVRLLVDEKEAAVFAHPKSLPGAELLAGVTFSDLRGQQRGSVKIVKPTEKELTL